MSNVTTPASTPLYEENSTEQSPPGIFNWLPVTWAIVIGHVLALASGLAYWNFRTRNGLYRMFSEEGATKRDIERLSYNGLLIGGIMILFMHLFAWWAAKNGEVKDYKTGLAKMGRTQWPNLIPFISLFPFAFLEAEKQHTLEFLWSAPFCMVLGLMAWQLFLWFPTYIPRWLSNENPAEKHPVKQLKSWIIPGLAITLAYCIYFSVLGVLRYFALGACIHDFSIYDQLMWNAYEGRWFETGMFNDEILGYGVRPYGDNFNAEHFVPTFYILYPLFWLFPHTGTMITGHAFMAGLAAIPVFFIALKKIGSPSLSLLMLIAFLVHPITQQGTIKDVHTDTLAPFFMLSALAFCLYDRKALMYIMLILAIGVKEEITIAVTAFGLFLFFGEKQRVHGPIVFLLGLASYVIILGHVIPYFRNGEESRHLDRFGQIVPVSWGIDPKDLTAGDLVKAMILRPDLTIGVLLQESRLRGLMMLIAPYAFLALFGRWVWLWIMPPLMIGLLSLLSMQYEMQQQYGTPHIAAFTVASIYGLAWILRRKLGPTDPVPAVRNAAGAIVLLAAIFFTWTNWSFFPGGERFNREDYVIMEHDRLGREYIDAIPMDAVVSGQIEIGTLLAPRRYFYMFPTKYDADWVILDTRAIVWPMTIEDYEEKVREMLTSGEWGLYKPYNDGFLLFRKGYSTELNEDALGRLDFSSYRRPRYPLESAYRRARPKVDD